MLDYFSSPTAKEGNALHKPINTLGIEENIWKGHDPISDLPINDKTKISNAAGGNIVESIVKLFNVISYIYLPIYLSLLLNTKVIDPSFQMEKLKALDKKTPHETSWVPIVWAINLLTSADNSDKHSLRIESPVFANLLKGIDKIEANNRKLLNYGWVNFPLAYTQVIMTSHFTHGTTGIIIIKTHQKLL